MKLGVRRIIASLVILVLAASALNLPVFADGTVTPVTGISVAASSATSGPTLSNETVTITRKGGLFNSSTCNITITNAGSATANISFSYAHSGSGSATLSGTTISSGTYSGILDAGASVTMTLLGAGGYATGTLTLSAFSWTEVSADAVATVTYDSTKGSVTLGGSSVASGGSATATNGTLAAVATPASGCTFLGWVNSDTNELMSAAASATLNVPQNMNVQAVFVKNDGSDTAWFLVDGATLHDDLNDAAEVANSTIVPMYDGILPAGDYTIPSGVTLLIPFDDANTLYTTAPELVTDNAAIVTPTAFRTLTMADGANITIEGAMSLSGKVHAYMGSRYQNSAPTGPSGFVKMEEGSSITVKGALYAWGYIVGSGTVSAESGSTIYECFQVRDWRGGDATSDMNNNDQRVFPISQYYVQNIEVPLTLKYGAKEKGFLATYVSYRKKTADFTFIGSDGMFRLSDENSSVTKHYDGTTDRLIIDVNGNMTMSSIVISIDTGIIGSVTLNSANYVLPINSNITVSIHEGSNVSVQQDMALLPGTVIEIEEDATLTLGAGTKIYVYDKAEWGPYVMQNVQLRPVLWSYANGSTVKRTADSLTDASVCINGTVDATGGYIYTTASGANIYSTGSGVITTAVDKEETVTYQATYANETISYSEIAITPAQLLNGDGTYVATGDDDKGAGTYTYVDGYWHGPGCDGTTTTETTKEATCTEKGTTATKCTCGIINTTEAISAIGHSYTYSVTTEPACTTTGVRTYTCQNDSSHTYTEEISALGHTSDAAVQENKQDDGSYESVVYCTICSVEISRTKVNVYSVTITWTDLNYVFTPTYTWNAEKLCYEVTDGSWSTTGGTVTIQNDSSASVVATLKAEAEENLDWTPTIRLTSAGGTVAAKGSLVSTITVKGTPYSANDGWLIASSDTSSTPTTIGTITITLTKGET